MRGVVPVLLFVATARAAWCALDFESEVARRTLGLVCERLSCTCDDSCVGHLGARSLVVSSVRLSLLLDDFPVPFRVDCERIGIAGPLLTAEELSALQGADRLTLRLLPDGASPERRTQLWRRVFPACSFQRLGPVVAVRGCTWHDLRAIHGSVLSVAFHSRPRVDSGPVRLQNRWSTPSLRPATSGLTGTGQVIGTIDSGVSMRSCYLRNEQLDQVPSFDCGATGEPPASGELVGAGRKVVQYVRNGQGLNTGACGAAGDSSGHGTHTSGTLAGSPLCAGTCPASMSDFSGVAPGAKLAVFDAGPDERGYLVMPDDVRFAYAWALRAGAAVHSNSWGASGNGQLTDIDYFSDAWMYSNPEFLIVAAAGNNGATQTPYVQSPATGKNVLTVGAVYSASEPRQLAFCGGLSYSPNLPECTANAPEGGIADFSARGSLVGAGRVKPDLVATGDVVWSAENVDTCLARAGGGSVWEENDVVPMAGTSMSTPLVAGAAALVRQFFADGFYPCATANSSRAWSRVPSSILRAVLVLSAETDAPALPRGYGRPLDIPALLDGGRFLVLGNAGGDGVASAPRLTSTGAVHTYELCAIGGERVRVVLAWTDPPVISDDPQYGLVMNDLDLVVLVGDTLTLSGNGAPRSRVSTIESAASPSAVAAGTAVTVQVSARRLLTFSQSYSVVVSGADATCGGYNGLYASCQRSSQSSASPGIRQTTQASSVVLVMDALLNATSVLLVGSRSDGTQLVFETELAGTQTRYTVSAPSEAPQSCGPVPGSNVWTVGPFFSVRSADAGETIVLSFSAVPDGRMYWRSQRVLFCNSTQAGWADVTLAVCRDRLQHESAVPFRVCAEGSANGTYVILDVHDTGRWDVTCQAGDWSGCTCDVPHATGYLDTFSPAVLGALLAFVVLVVDGVPEKQLRVVRASAAVAVGVCAMGRMESPFAAAMLSIGIPVTLFLQVCLVLDTAPIVQWMILGLGVGSTALASVLEWTLGSYSTDPSVTVALLAVPVSSALLVSLDHGLHVPLYAVSVVTAAGASTLSPILSYILFALVPFAHVEALRGTLSALVCVLCALCYTFAPCSTRISV